MDQYELIRTARRVYGKSIREIRRQTGHHRKTIRKALRGEEPKYRRKKKVVCPVMDPVAPVIARWLREDEQRPKKQRHTAHRVYGRLVDEQGFEGAESTVRRWVREWKAAQGQSGKEAVVPLDPEVAREAEVDWGTAWVEMAGKSRQVKMFVMRSRYSGKPFIRAYPWERQEMFFDAHMHAFAYYGGVHRRIVYDNLSVAVKGILRGKKRREQEQFVSFRSYYTFEAHFCNPARGQEKGGVEGLIGFARRNFLVPLPRIQDFEELNEQLLRSCLEYGDHRLRGREEDRTVNERFEEEAAQLIPLPRRPFVNLKAFKVKVDPYQTVRIDRNRYSVPRACVGRWIWAHLGCCEVTLYAEDRKVAEHPRLFSNTHWQLDPLHYLDLIEQRPQSFDRARPILQWRSRWPPQYEAALSELRRRWGENRGTQEFVRILKLHERYPAEAMGRAVDRTLAYQCMSYDAVLHLLDDRQDSERPVPPLPADLIPGVTDRQVSQTEVARFNTLLGGQR
jgi:transposase